ncbi:hypothetical protein LCGC14_2886550 [marine sediment metagenome]|uniref:Uncharacterized protein n=1 Tax=marine sediment metagenome TaxID=412755 RepID=A0A0F8YKB4_9ZZZZ
MVLNHTMRRKVLWLAALLLALLVIFGCAEIKPYEPRNNREEGPAKGLFTGSEGEFVIMRKAEEPKKESEDKKSPDEPESAAQPEPSRDESGSVDKPPGDNP